MDTRDGFGGVCVADDPGDPPDACPDREVRQPAREVLERDQAQRARDAANRLIDEIMSKEG